MIQSKNVGQSLKKRSIWVNVAALTAGSDLADLPLCRIPCSAELLGVNILPQGADANIDNDNTSAWVVEVGSTTIASKTYNTTVTFPDAGVVGALTITTTVANRKLAEGNVILLTVTNGTTAATPACQIEIEYIISDAAQFDTAHVAATAT